MGTGELFSNADRERIAAAIGAAEAGTSGEIVPVVAGASGRYDRAEDIVGVLAALLLISAVWIAGAGSGVPESDWGGRAGTAAGLGLLLAAGAAGFLGGAWLASRLPWLRLPFINGTEMREEVERSAEAAFHRFRLRETAGATGILIYVSIYERQVRVLGDAAIAAKLQTADWQNLCDAVTRGMATGRPADAIVRGIELAGELLGRHFPRESGDRDELLNELVLID